MTELIALDLHCHTSASFDGRTDPLRVVTLAHERGVTHIAITDHDTLAGAIAARAQAPAGVEVMLGEEIRTTEGDMIGLYLDTAIPSGMTPEETAAAIRAAGGLVGLPHPFDVYRPSLARGAIRPQERSRLAMLADYVEVYNSRVGEPRTNELAADFAHDFDLPGVAVSDAHREGEVGIAYTVVNGPVAGPDQLRAALRAAVKLHVREPVWDEEASGWQRLRSRLRGTQ